MLTLGVFLLAAARGSSAQGTSADAEFTRQALLITNFALGPGADRKLGVKAADAVRSHVLKLANRKELAVLSGDDIRNLMRDAAFDPNAPISPREVYTLGRQLRADEYLLGTVSSGPTGVRLVATLVLMRDERMRQPLPPVSAAKLDDAALIMARQIVAARAQLAYQRRCENALRDNAGDRALRAAEQGVALYPNSTLARLCLVWAMRTTGTTHEKALAEAKQILAIDSTSPHAMEAAATALDGLKRKEAAAQMWLRLVATDTLNLELARRVIFALVDGGNARAAETLVLHLSASYPDDLRLNQQKWYVSYETGNWPKAIEAGEIMVARDSLAQADSTFWLRLGKVYHELHLSYKAINALTHAVERFPGDGRLYGLYAQYVREEAEVVVPRGLQSFPRSAELLAMSAKDLRAKGKLEESLNASRAALAVDSTMVRGALVIAQLELDLNRPDSALLSVRKAVAAGEDSLVASQFALAKGNALYRSATGTLVVGDFQVAMQFLLLADSLRSTVQSRFLIGAAALGVVQSALTQAPRTSDRPEQCRLARLATTMAPIAREALTAGQAEYAEPARQSLAYLAQLEPFAARQVTAYCLGP